MKFKPFVNKYSTAPIDEKKVAKVIKAYGWDLPEELQHFISACKNEIFVENDSSSADFRVFSLDEIINAETHLNSDFKSKKMIPVIDYYDNQFLVYQIDKRNWGLFSMDDDIIFDENESMAELLSLTRYFERVLAKAESGDVEAMVELGDCYNYGMGVRTSGSKSLTWYKKAAELGNSEAMKNIAEAYRHGNGVKQDEAKAKEWYRMAAKNGNLEAQATLEKWLDETKKENSEWEQAQKKAAEGDAKSLKYLGVSYLGGYPPAEKDVEKGLEYLLKAAEFGYAPAMDRLGDHYKNASQYEIALSWYKKAAEQEVPASVAQEEDPHNRLRDPVYKSIVNSIGKIGLFYWDGLGVEKDLDKAIEWFVKASNMGDRNILHDHASALFWGHGDFGKDVDKALELFTISGNNGDTAAMENLAYWFKKGIQVPKDLEKAVYWEKKIEEWRNKIHKGA